MGDQSPVNETFCSQWNNERQPQFRNTRQFRGGRRGPRQTQQYTGDQYFYQNNNSRAVVDGHFPRQNNSLYQSYGGTNVSNYRDKGNEKHYSKYRGNSSRYRNDRQLTDDQNIGKVDIVDKTVSHNESQVTATFQTSTSSSANSSEREGAYASFDTTNCSSETREHNDSTIDQRGYVVGGRYMRKSNSYLSRREINASKPYSDQNYYSSKPPERNNLRTENPTNYRFQRSGYLNGHNNRDSHSGRGYNFRGRQKSSYVVARSDRSQTPDINDNFSAPSYSAEVSSSTSSIHDVSSRSGSSYRSSPHRKDRIIANEKFHTHNTSQHSTKGCVEEDEATQKDRLIVQLHKGECECMVCCESIRNRDQIWHCSSCYHVFHLKCIRKWARSPAALVEDSGWRCPACQNITKKVPLSYYCFCGKLKDPEVSHHLTPHSCGEVCQKERPDELCPHRCNILCHPGPCPPCSATITRQCGCGRVKKTVPCRQQSTICCGSVCSKILNCGLHQCKSVCHTGDCEPCSVIQNQVCFCGKNEQQVPCTQETANCMNFLCGSVCEKKLECENHYCEDLCHPGPCAPCALLPSSVDRCPCGKTPVKWLYDKNEALIRKTCVDPIPVCSASCNKVLKCGPKENPHTCDSKCHLGECPPCPLSTTVKCRCGAVTKDQSCVEYVSRTTFLCEKRCSKRKDCGRHKCLTLCCVGLDHVCELVCNKKLSCGTHHCEEKCHMGNCPPCKNVSFDELTCHCGTAVLYPPIHCGTKPPECKELCIRNHQCDHPVQHRCHSEETCPPCTVLTVKWCFGKHTQRKNVQCFLDGISCGLPCGKPLPCNVHKCQEICHEGPCLKNSTQCTQPCVKIRADCEHQCGSPCHEGQCPDTPCKAKVNVSCPCGNRTEVVLCSDSSKSFHLVSMSMLASKMQDIKLGQSVNMSDVLGKKGKLNRLQCNEECAVLERNKRLAIALQIQNPDLSCKPGPPNYSEFLKDETKKSPQFVLGIYEKLTELVHLAKESKKKSRSHAFPPMNRDQRRVVHELAEFFGCESQSYDEEPKKSVTVTAFRERSWLPFVGIMTVVQREMGQRKGPTPVIPRGDTKVGAPPTQQKERTIDYFDFKEDS